MKQQSHFLTLGFAILVMCSSGALGRFIELPAPPIIWIRCVIGAIALYLVLRLFGDSVRLGGNKFGLFLLSSLLLGAHWVTYFFALKLSTVAIGMLSLFTYPVISALLEPILLKVPFQKTSIFLGVIAFIGVALLAPEMTLENDYTLGIVVGIISALCYSLRNILLKKRVSDQSGITLMFYQLLINALVLWPFMFFYPVTVNEIADNWSGLLILGLFTTALGHTLFVMSFRYFSISTVSVISALTPLFGTILGFLVLGEVPAGRTYIGGGLVLVTVITESILSVKSGKKLRKTD